MTRALYLALALGLAGCVGSPMMTASMASISGAQQELQAAIQLYGIAKGVAEVAAVSDPALAPILLSTTVTLDPLVDRAQAMLTAGVSDAAAIEALAASISAQADALELAAAPVIKVVPSAASGESS